MSNNNHIPVRMCIACRERKNKDEFIRIVKLPDEANSVILDKTCKSPGRGAYMCKNPKCLKETIKKQKLQRALKTQISQKLMHELEEIINE